MVQISTLEMRQESNLRSETQSAKKEELKFVFHSPRLWVKLFL